MAFAARREGLPPDQGYLMGQTMLRVNHALNSAFGDEGRAFKKFSHMMCTFEQPSVRESRLTAYRCNSHLPSWYRLILRDSVAQLWFASIVASHKRTCVSAIG